MQSSKTHFNTDCYFSSLNSILRGKKSIYVGVYLFLYVNKYMKLVNICPKPTENNLQTTNNFITTMCTTFSVEKSCSQAKFGVFTDCTSERVQSLRRGLLDFLYLNQPALKQNLHLPTIAYCNIQNSACRQNSDLGGRLHLIQDQLHLTEERTRRQNKCK